MDLPEQAELQDLLEQVEPQDLLERVVLQDLLEQADLLDHQVLPEHLVQVVLLEQLVHRVIKEVCYMNMVPFLLVNFHLTQHHQSVVLIQYTLMIPLLMEQMLVVI